MLDWCERCLQSVLSTNLFCNVALLSNVHIYVHICYVRPSLCDHSMAKYRNTLHMLPTKLFLKQSEVMSPLSRPISLLHFKHFSLETVADICDTLQVIYECCVHLMLSRRLLYCLLKAVTDGPPRMQLHAVSICAHNYSALWTALVASPAAHPLQVSSVWPSTIKCHDVHGDDPCSQLISVPV